LYREEIVLSKLEVEKMETAKEEKTLEELRTQLGSSVAEQRQIEMKIKKQKKLIAMKKGEVVKYKKDLKCERHPNAKFIRTDKIGEGILGLLGGSFSYTCQECRKEVKAGKLNPFQASTAYKCPFCGFVKGNYSSRPYKSPPESWRALAGREGTHYHCRICGTMIGYHYWRIS
jgi:DNA-directed RNA polymerase subunit RPC12/RpoP